MDAAERKGRPLPQWYLDEPELMPGDVFYLEAFRSLGTERQIGVAQGPIPDSKVIEYGRRAGLDQDVIDGLLVPVVREMDTEYLKWSTEQSERESKQRSRGGIKKNARS